MRSSRRVFGSRESLAENTPGAGGWGRHSHGARQSRRNVHGLDRLFEYARAELRAVEAQRRPNIVVVQRSVGDAAHWPKVLYVLGAIQEHHVAGPAGKKAIAEALLPVVMDGAVAPRRVIGSHLRLFQG